MLIPTRLIQLDNKDHVRLECDLISKTLMRSMLGYGQLNKITVIKLNHPDFKYKVIRGFRRFSSIATNVIDCYVAEDSDYISRDYHASNSVRS